MPYVFYDAIDHMTSDLEANTVKDTSKDTRYAYHDPNSGVGREAP